MAHPSVRFLLFLPPRTPHPLHPSGFRAERKPRQSRSRTKRNTVLSYSLHLLPLLHIRTLGCRSFSRPLFLARERESPLTPTFLSRRSLSLSRSRSRSFSLVRSSRRSSRFNPRTAARQRFFRLPLILSRCPAVSLSLAASLVRALYPSLSDPRHPRSLLSVPPSLSTLSVAPSLVLALSLEQPINSVGRRELRTTILSLSSHRPTVLTPI